MNKILGQIEYKATGKSQSNFKSRQRSVANKKTPLSRGTFYYNGHDCFVLHRTINCLWLQSENRYTTMQPRYLLRYNQFCPQITFYSQLLNVVKIVQWYAKTWQGKRKSSNAHTPERQTGNLDETSRKKISKPKTEIAKTTKQKN